METTVEPKKNRKVFRNAGNRIFYLRPRPGESKEFMFGPGMTIEAQDDAEENQLSTIHQDFRDVALETPALANAMSSLQTQLAEEKEKNKVLLAEKKALEEQKEKVDGQTGKRGKKS